MTISKPFYIFSVPLALSDLVISLVDDTITPYTEISTPDVVLESLTAEIGQGWYRVSGLPIVTSPRTLLVFQLINLTTPLLIQTWDNLNSILTTTNNIYDLIRGNGIFPVIITCLENSLGNSIPDVKISIWNQDLTELLIPEKITGLDGTTTVFLQPGTYKAVYYKQGSSFPDATIFTVIDSLLEIQVEATTEISNPSIIGKCKVFGWVKDPALNPIVATKIKYMISPNPQNLKGVLFDRSVYEQILTDENGYFEIVLAGGLAVTFTIPVTGFSATGVIPNLGSIQVTDLNRQY